MGNIGSAVGSPRIKDSIVFDDDDDGDDSTPLYYNYLSSRFGNNTEIQMILIMPSWTDVIL